MADASRNDLHISEDRVLRACISNYYDHHMHELSMSADSMEYNGIELSTEEISRIGKKLLLLPHEARYVLFGEYCFNLTFEAIQEMFGLSEPHGISLWYKRLLSNLAGLDKEKHIGDASMRRICMEALDTYTRDLEHAAENGADKIHPYKKRRMIVMLKKSIAAAAIFLVVMFTGTMAVSAEFRERVVNWFVETFGEFSLFDSESEADVSLDEMRLFNPGYVPAGYMLRETYEIENGISFDYSDNDNELIILITMPGAGWMIDTEKMDVLEMEYGGEKAYYYNNVNESRFIFVKDGYPMYILGNIDMDECIKIANEIKK